METFGADSDDDELVCFTIPGLTVEQGCQGTFCPGVNYDCGYCAKYHQPGGVNLGGTCVDHKRDKWGHASEKASCDGRSLADDPKDVTKEVCEQSDGLWCSAPF